MPKKLVEVPLADRIDAALMEAKNYSLIQDNDELNALFKNKFKLDNGAELPPQEFIAKMIDHIENNPPQTAEAFALFVRSTIAAVPAPVATKKKVLWK
jgi:hypothetical protein